MNCKDCNKGTCNEVDYYMVTFDLWDSYGVGKDFLCKACFEIRLGRPLIKSDYLDCLLNKMHNFI